MKKSYSTNLSTALFALLSSAKTPLLYKDINNLMERQNLYYNKTSVYRQLDSMKQHKEITSIETHRGTAWEVIKNEHAHIACDTCDTIECIEIPTQFIPNNVLQKLNFSSIRTQFSGVCAQCIQL